MLICIDSLTEVGVDVGVDVGVWRSALPDNNESQWEQYKGNLQFEYDINGTGKLQLTEVGVLVGVEVGVDVGVLVGVEVGVYEK